MSKDNKPLPDGDARFPKSFSLARNRALKKAAIWTGAICTTAFGLVLLTGGLLGANHGFTTKIDRGSSLDQIVLRENRQQAGQRDQDGVYFLNAEGLTNAKPTRAEKVLEFCSDLYEDPDLAGNHVLVDEEGNQRALAYTFYLENASQRAEPQNFTFYISLDAYIAPSNAGAANPYSYLRVLVYRNVEGSGLHEHTFYAAPNDQGMGTVDGGPNDLRECLSDWAEAKEGDKTLRRPTFFDGEVGYCKNFASNTSELIREDDLIEKGQVIRYTIVTYFEGLDPDCIGAYPNNSSLSLSAHFGD